MFNPAFLEAFSRQNLISGFSKAGIFPLNQLAIPDEALTTNTAMVGNSTENVDQPADDTPSVTNNVNDILHVPQFTMTSVSKPARKRRNPAASVHLPKNGMPTGEEPACGPSTSSVLPECSNTSASASITTSARRKCQNKTKK